MEHSGLHTTVLLHEAIDALVTQPDGIYVDGTFGRGGHTRELLSRLGPGARVIGIDRDPVAVAAAQDGPDAVRDPRFQIVHASFAQLPAALAERGIGKITGLLLDWACRRRRSTPPSADSASVSTVRSTCAWTPPAARPPPTFSLGPTSVTLQR